MIRRLRIWRAQRKLEKLLAKRLQSYEHRRYLERRQAALRGMGRA